MTLQSLTSGLNLATALGAAIHKNLDTIPPAENCHERKELYADFFRQVGMTENLVLAEQGSLMGCSSQGNNLTGRASICMLPGLFDLDKDAYGFILKHEAGHIIANDLITMPMAGIISIIAGTYFSNKNRCGFLAHYLFLNIISLLSMAAVSQWREAKADDFAIKHSTHQELIGGARFFEGIKSMTEGGLNIDFLHPSLSSRIQKIRNELVRRGVSNFTESNQFMYKYRLTNLVSSSQTEGLEKLQRKLLAVQSFFMNFFPTK